MHRRLPARSLTRLRRPLFGRHGAWVVAGCCTWELAALCPRSPLPPLTSLVRRFWPFGAVLLLVLAHHFFVELEDHP